MPIQPLVKNQATPESKSTDSGVTEIKILQNRENNLSTESNDLFAGTANSEAQSVITLSDNNLIDKNLNLKNNEQDKKPGKSEKLSTQNRPKKALGLSIIILLNHFIYIATVNYLAKDTFRSDFVFLGNFVFAIISLVAFVYSFPCYFRSIFKSAITLKPTRPLLEFTAFLLVFVGIVDSFYNAIKINSDDVFSDVFYSFYYQDFLYLLVAFLTYKTVDARAYNVLGKVSKFKLPTFVLQLRDQQFFNIQSVAELKSLANELNTNLIVDGQKLLFETGSILPVDCKIISGLAFVEQFTSSGDFNKVIKGVDATLYAGSKIILGNIVCEALGQVDDSDLSYFLDHVKQTQNRAISEVSLKKLLIKEQWYNLALIFISAASGIYWYQNNSELNQVFNISASILLLGLLPRYWMFELAIDRVTPLAFFKRGVVYVGSKFDKLISKVSTLYLKDEPQDLILKPKIVNFNLLDQRVDTGKFMPLLAQLIYMSQDSLIEAFDEYFNINKINPTLEPFEKFFITPGKGARITINGAHIMFGSEQYLLENKVTIQRSDIEETVVATDKRFVVIGDLLVASFILHNTKISENKHSLSLLKKMKIDSSLFSYKNSNAAEKLSDLYGFERNKLLVLKDVKSFAEKIDSQVSNTNKAAVALLNKEEAFRINNLSNALTIGEFDNVEYSLKNYDITVVHNKMNYLVDVIKFVRTLTFYKSLARSIVIAATIVLCVFSISGSLLAWQIMAILTCLTVGIYAVGNRTVV